MKLYGAVGHLLALKDNTMVLFDANGDAIDQRSLDEYTSPTADECDINSLDKSVAGNILKTMYWRLDARNG